MPDYRKCEYAAGTNNLALLKKITITWLFMEFTNMHKCRSRWASRDTEVGSESRSAMAMG